MPDTFDQSERDELGARGFTVNDTTAEIAGPMTVRAVPHGHYHFLITITLPGGNMISGFVPKSRIISNRATAAEVLAGTKVSE